MDELDKQFQEIIDSVPEKKIDEKIKSFGLFLEKHGYSVVPRSELAQSPAPARRAVMQQVPVRQTIQHNVVETEDIVHLIDELICGAELLVTELPTWFFGPGKELKENLGYARNILSNLSAHIYSRIGECKLGDEIIILDDMLRRLKERIPNSHMVPQITGHPIALKLHSLRALMATVAAKIARSPSHKHFSPISEKLFDFFYFSARYVNIKTGHKEFVK